VRLGIFFDTFLQGGGAEKILAVLAKEFDADIITSGYKQELYREWLDSRVIDLGNVTHHFNNRLGFLETAARFHFNRKKFDYDFNVFCGIFSIFAASSNKPNVWLCLSPNRTIYDLKERRLAETKGIPRVLLKKYIEWLMPLDQRVVKEHIQRIYTISRTGSDRVKRFYGLNSSIVNPPIAAEKYCFKKFGDFFFTANRLIPEKRVDLIARAFTEMPEKKLVIAGFGPEEGKIRKIIGGFNNIEFVGRLPEKELVRYYAECLATVFMPLNEDFGMVPLEGNAAGKACIAVNDGGCRETVVQGKTGFLIEPTEQAIIEAVKVFSPENAKEMKGYCLKQAKRFSTKAYLDNWRKIISEAVE